MSPRRQAAKKFNLKTCHGREIVEAGISSAENLKAASTLKLCEQFAKKFTQN